MRVGWIGLGQMGRPMVGRLLDGGFEVLIWARRREAARGVLAAGASWVDSPAALVGRVDVIATMLGGPADTEGLLLGEDGLIARADRATLFIDLTTSSPASAARLDAAARSRGTFVIDSPASGGPAGAVAGTLSLMVGGDATAVARIRPILDRLGTTVIHHGPVGAGQAAKLANQVLLAGSMAGIVEAFEAAARLGLDPDLVERSLDAGIARSPLLGFVWSRLVAWDMAPGFRVDLMVKDLELALDATGDDGPPLAYTEAVLARYRLLAAEGHGALGTQALGLATRGTAWPMDVTTAATGR